LFARALTGGSAPVEVITDRAPFYPGVVDALVRTARQVTERYESNRIEADHGRLRRGCVRCGVKTIKSLQVVATGYAFVQDLRRGHYERTVDLPLHDRVRPAFAQLADCL
jgi:transposase-like protein